MLFVVLRDAPLVIVADSNSGHPDRRVPVCEPHGEVWYCRHQQKIVVEGVFEGLDEALHDARGVKLEGCADSLKGRRHFYVD